MSKKLVAPLMALTLALGASFAAADQAHAGRGGRVAAGVIAGAIGLGILGAYANARPRHHYRSSCYQVGGGCYFKEGHCFHNRYGEYVCRRGYQVCDRPRTVCD